MHRIPVPILCVFILLATTATNAEDTHCPGEPFEVYIDSYIELFVCSNGQERIVDRFFEPPLGINAFEVKRPSSSTLVVVNVPGNLAADTKSGTVLVYDANSSEQLLKGYSKISANASDMNSDGIIELVLFENFLAFNSLLLSDVGWPTIIELGDPITIGTIEDYDSLRKRLLHSSIEAKRTFEEACIFDGAHDPLCGAVPDIKALDLFINILSIPHPN